MKIETANTNDVNTNINNTNTFKINASAKAFRILSDSIYTDKITAVQRELITNALDAVAVKGSGEVTVHSPTKLDPTFSVADSGIGMTETELVELYTTYFASNKADSNDVTGALGLGSKSPFAYTDSFSVVSKKEGKEVTLLAFVNSNDLFEFSILSVKDISDDETGTTVSFAVKAEDVSTFEEKLVRLAKWIDGPISYNKDSVKAIAATEKVVAVGNYSLYVSDEEMSSYSSAVFVKMGPIVYPTSFSALSYMPERVVNQYNIKLNFNKSVIEVPMGAVDIAPSRETLDSTPRTVEAIKTALTEISEYFENQVKAVPTASDKVDFVKKYANLLEVVSAELTPDADLRIKVRGNNGRISSIHKHTGYMVVELSSKGRLKSRFTEEISSGVEFDSKVANRFDYDSSYSFKKKLKAYMAANDITTVYMVSDSLIQSLTKLGLAVSIDKDVRNTKATTSTSYKKRESVDVSTILARSVGYSMRINGEAKHKTYEDLKNEEVVFIYKDYARQSSVVSKYSGLLNQLKSFSPVIAITPSEMIRFRSNCKKAIPNVKIVELDKSMVEFETMLLAKLRKLFNVRKWKKLYASVEDKPFLLESFRENYSDGAIYLTDEIAYTVADLSSYSIVGALRNSSNSKIVKLYEDYEDIMNKLASKVVFDSFKAAETEDLANIKDVLHDMDCNSALVTKIFTAGNRGNDVLRLSYMNNALTTLFDNLNGTRVSDAVATIAPMNELIAKYYTSYNSLEIEKGAYKLALATYHICNN
jgi:hypothetical protein